MADRRDTPEHSEGSPLVRNLPTLVAGFLGALAIVAYPIGFFAYWVQIWSEYTHDPTTALYAAALIPVPVAVGRAVGVLVVAVVAGSISTWAASGLAYFKFFFTSIPAEESSRFVGFAFSRFGLVVFVIPTVVTSASAPLAFQLVVLESGSVIFFYACAGIIAGASGLIGSWLILGSHPTKGQTYDLAYRESSVSPRGP